MERHKSKKGIPLESGPQLGFESWWTPTSFPYVSVSLQFECRNDHQGPLAGRQCAGPHSRQILRVRRGLVADALRRIATAVGVIGVRAVLVHCETEAARDFSMRLAKFEVSPTDPMHLLLFMKDLHGALRG